MHMEWYGVRLTAQVIPLVLKCSVSPSAWLDCSFMCALEESQQCCQCWAALSGAGCCYMWLCDLSPHWCPLSFCVPMAYPLSEVSAVQMTLISDPALHLKLSVGLVHKL